MASFLERKSLVEQDAENSYLAFEGLEDDLTRQHYGHSITTRTTVEPQPGRKERLRPSGVADGSFFSSVTMGE